MIPVPFRTLWIIGFTTAFPTAFGLGMLFGVYAFTQTHYLCWGSDCETMAHLIHSYPPAVIPGLLLACLAAWYKGRPSPHEAQAPRRRILSRVQRVGFWL